MIILAPKDPKEILEVLPNVEVGEFLHFFAYSDIAYSSQKIFSLTLRQIERMLAAYKAATQINKKLYGSEYAKRMSVLEVLKQNHEESSKT